MKSYMVLIYHGIGYTSVYVEKADYATEAQISAREKFEHGNSWSEIDRIESRIVDDSGFVGDFRKISDKY